MLGRGVVAMLVTLVLAGSGASAQERNCRGVRIGQDFVEWMEGLTPHGVKFVGGDAGWQRLITQEAIYLASCKSCRGGRGLDAVFFAVIEDRAQQNLSLLLQPAHVASLWSRLPGFARLEVQSSGAIELQTVFGLDGMARRISADAGGNPVELLAIAASSGCLVFLGFVILPNQPGLAADDFRPFATAMTLEPYVPSAAAPQPQLPLFGQDCYLPLGEARRRCQAVWPR